MPRSAEMPRSAPAALRHRLLLVGCLHAGMRTSSGTRCALPPESTCWDALTPSQRAGAEALGWESTGWDCVRERGGADGPGACTVPVAESTPWRSLCSDVLIYTREDCEGSGRCFRGGASNELMLPPAADLAGQQSWSADDVASGAAGDACAEHLVLANYTGPTEGFWSFSGGEGIALVQNSWEQGLTVDEVAGATALGWSEATWRQGLSARPAVSCSASHGDHSTAALEGRGALLGFGRSSSGQVGLSPGGGGHGAEIASGDVSRWGIALDSGVSQVSAGGYHSAVVTLDGSLVSFGDNQFGQLGRDWLCTGEDGRGPHGPSVVPLDGSDGCNGGAVEAGCGRYHTAVLCADGSVRTFGRGVEGQLGGGSFEFERSTPGVVAAVGENNVAVIAGGYHTLVAKASGALVSFGRNTHGQLCTGSTAESVHTPEAVDLGSVFRFDDAGEAIPVVGAYVNAGLISAGAYHTLMQLHLPGAASDGGEGVALYGCGRNREGQLGLGDKVMVGRYEQTVVVDDIDDRSTPTSIPAFDVAQNEADGVVQIAAGGWHSLVLMSSGTVWSFGSNDAGQLGIGLTTYNQPRLAADANYLEYTIDGLAAALKFVHPHRVCVDCGVVGIAAGGQTSLLIKSMAVGEALDAAVGGAPVCPVAAADSAVDLSADEYATLGSQGSQLLASRSTDCLVNDGTAVFGFGRNDDAQLGGAGGGAAAAAASDLQVRIGSQTALGLGCLDGRGDGSWKVTGGIADASATGVSVASVAAVAVGWHHTLVVTGLQCRGGTVADENVPDGCPTRVCAACAAGRWATRSAGSAAAADCRACGPGTVAVAPDAMTMALADTNGDGLLSESEFDTAGRPANELAPTHSENCAACPAGTASLTHDAVWTGPTDTPCAQCIAGEYGHLAEARCALCPRGRYSEAVGSSTVDVCIGCPIGQYSAARGSASDASCVPCAAGSFPAGTGTGATGCELCPVGRAMAAGTLADGCVECAPGQYSAGFPAPGAAECVVCEAGRFMYDPPLSGILLELFLQKDHAPCELCKVGLWSDALGATGRSDDVACKSCPSGRFSRVVGATSDGSCEIRNEMVTKSSGAVGATTSGAVLLLLLLLRMLLLL